MPTREVRRFEGRCGYQLEAEGTGSNAPGVQMFLPTSNPRWLLACMFVSTTGLTRAWACSSPDAVVSHGVSARETTPSLTRTKPAFADPGSARPTESSAVDQPSTGQADLGEGLTNVLFCW